MINSINKALLWLGAITTVLWIILSGVNLGPMSLIFPTIMITWWRFILWDAKTNNWFVVKARENEAIWSVSGDSVPKKPIFTSEGKKVVKNGDIREAPGKVPGIMKGPGIFGSGIYFLDNFGVLGGVKILFRKMSWLEYEQKDKAFDLIPRVKEETPYIYTKTANYAVVLNSIEDMDGLRVDLIIGVPGFFHNVKKPVFKVDEPFARIQNILQDAVVKLALEELNFDFMTQTEGNGENGNILKRKRTFERIKEVIKESHSRIAEEVGFTIVQEMIISFELAGAIGQQIYEKLAGVETARLDARITVMNAEALADAAIHEAKATTVKGKAEAQVIKDKGIETNKILKQRKEELGEFAFGMHEFNEGISNFQGEAISINIGSDAKSNLQFVKPIGGGGGNKGGGNTPPKKTKQIKQKN
jgi:hypothetical protein